jgi:GT2 family glycosyltransferase
MSARLGVVIVAFNSADVILDCLESLLSGPDPDRLCVAVVDNASADGTPGAISAWAAARPMAVEELAPGEKAGGGAPLLLIRSPVNGGYAFGVNLGLKALHGLGGFAGYWILNPDCVAPPHVPGKYLDALASTDAGMIGSRCLYLEEPDVIQTDGGRVSRWTGVCRSANAGLPAATTPLPDPHSLDFLTGANFVVRPAFLDRVGPMREDYFLYYEEVDWAWRRGGERLALVPGAEIHHRGGTAIGSGTRHRAASPMSLYFNQRNRMRFVRRRLPLSYPVALAWTFAKAAQLWLRDGRAAAAALLAGALDRPPPAAVAERIPDPEARRLAFGRHADSLSV